MSKSTITDAGAAAAGLTAAALIAGAPYALAETATPTTTPSATSTASPAGTASTTPSASTTPGASGSATPKPTGTTRPQRKQSRGTVVTGDEAATVVAAVTAKYPSLSDTTVRKHTDGTYHVSGTLNGTKVAYHVTADLKAVTERELRARRK